METAVDGLSSLAADANYDLQNQDHQVLLASIGTALPCLSMEKSRDPHGLARPCRHLWA